MIGEAKNTFLGGMITDSHPLNTPNTVLTSCLNGTLVTFNGNEMILQNDMGNAEIGTAYLPNGYIPVGMKEYGGIIYVAAYNPETGKGQVGCYPSPEQLYSGNEVNIGTAVVNLNNLLDPISVGQTILAGQPTLETTSINKITLDSYTITLFSNKVFSIGDKFIITSGEFSSDIINALNDGFLEMHLGVINSSGEIEYIDDTLRKFTHSKTEDLITVTTTHWLYTLPDDTTSIDDTLKDASKVNVYSYKTSGKLVLVVKLNTFTAFNLKKEYSVGSNGAITATLSGELSGTFSGKTKDNADVLLLGANVKGIPYTIMDYLSLTGTNDTVNYTVYPLCKYGFLDRMKKTGSIDFSTLKKNLNKLTHWSYFVNEDTYVKLYWKYDYFDLSGTTSINSAKFSFYKINNTNYSDIITNITNKTIVALGADYTVEVSQDSFSGDFETIVPFGDSFTKGDIYLVTFAIKTDTNYQVVDNGFQFLYTSPIYNEYYGQVDFNTISRPTITIGTKISISNNNTSTHTTSYGVDYGTIVNNAEQSQVGTVTFADSTSKSNYVTPYVSGDNNINYWKTTRRTVYDMSYNVGVDWDYDNTKYLGDISTLDVGDVTLEIVSTAQSTVTTLGTTSLQSRLATTNLDSIEITAGTGINRNIKVTSDRQIYGMSNGTANITRSSEFLVPYYEYGMGAEDAANIFNFKNNGAKLLGLYCYSGGTAANYELLSKSGGDTVTNNDDDDGVNIANTAMSNGNGTVNIINFGNGFSVNNVGTIPNTNLAYPFNYTYVHEDVANNQQDWAGVGGTTDGGLTRGRDALYAVFSGPNGRAYVTPFMSHINCTTDTRVTTWASTMEETNTNAYVTRLDMMLKCLFSQICAVQYLSKTTTWLYPNTANYAYHGDFAPSFNLDYTVTINGTHTVNLPGSSTTLDEAINTIVSAVKGKYTSTIDNYLPQYTISTSSNSNDVLTVDTVNSISSDVSLVGCYTNALTYLNGLDNITLPSTVDRSKLYIGMADTTKSRNTDGTIPLKYDSLGNAQVALSQYQMYDWNGRLFYINPWVKRSESEAYGLRYTIDDIFTNEYYVKYGSSNVNEVRDFFNKFYVRDRSETGIIDKWGNGENAPNLFPEIGFGYKTGYYPTLKTIS